MRSLMFSSRIPSFSETFFKFSNMQQHSTWYVITIIFIIIIIIIIILNFC